MMRFSLQAAQVRLNCKLTAVYKNTREPVWSLETEKKLPVLLFACVLMKFSATYFHRYYYKTGILERVDRRLVYKFGKNAHGWQEDKL